MSPPLHHLPAAGRQGPGPKQPPNSIEAEQAVLGGLLLSNRAWLDVSDVLSEEDFYTADHRMLWTAIAAMLNAGKPCDFVTLSEYLRLQGDLEAAGGMAYLGQLATDTPSAANIKAYAEIVRERSVLRSLIAAGQDLTELGYQPDGRAAPELIDIAEQRLFEVRNRGARGANQAEAYATLIERVERGVERRRGQSTIAGLSYGLTELDTFTTGMHPGELIIAAGRPGMGKTLLGLNAAEHCAINLGKPALVFSMEMPKEQLSLRSIASQARIPLSILRTGDLDAIHYDQMAHVGGALRAAPLFIDDTGALSPNEMRSRARRHKARHGLGLIVVDYVQLMQIKGSRSRENEVSECSRSLKALAKELAVPVLALSQIGRAVEERPDKRPRMSDLRESGGIENDADVVLLLYRDDYYDKKSAHAGIAEINVAKQRNGPTGTIDTAFYGAECRFDNYYGPSRAERRAVADSGSEPTKKRGWTKSRKAAVHGPSAPPAPAPTEADYPE